MRLPPSLGMTFVTVPLYASSAVPPPSVTLISPTYACEIRKNAAAPPSPRTPPTLAPSIRIQRIARLRAVTRRVHLLATAWSTGDALSDDARHQCGEPLRRPRCHRDRVEQLSRHHLIGSDVLHVDERCGAAHRNRLRDRADFEVGADRRRKGRRKLDAFTPHAAESRQAECDGVQPGRKIENAVRPVFGGHHRAHLLDQRRTRGLDGHPRQDATVAVAHHARNAAVAGLPGSECRRDERHEARKNHRPHDRCHCSSYACSSHDAEPFQQSYCASRVACHATICHDPFRRRCTLV